MPLSPEAAQSAELSRHERQVIAHRILGMRDGNENLLDEVVLPVLKNWVESKKKAFTDSKLSDSDQIVRERLVQYRAVEEVLGVFDQAINSGAVAARG